MALQWGYAVELTKEVCAQSILFFTTPYANSA